MVDQIQQALDRAMPFIALELSNELKFAVPVDTGRLRNSIKVFKTSSGLRIFMADYGKYIEFGTLPHTITPKNKQALSFNIGGKITRAATSYINFSNRVDIHLDFFHHCLYITQGNTPYYVPDNPPAPVITPSD